MTMMIISASSRTTKTSATRFKISFRSLTCLRPGMMSSVKWRLGATRARFSSGKKTMLWISALAWKSPRRRRPHPQHQGQEQGSSSTKLWFLT